jgi:hypothetical protein
MASRLSVMVVGSVGLVAQALAGPLDEPAPKSLAQLEQQFADPGPAYRIQMLLRTNDDVDPQELRWQIAQMKEKGCGGVFSYCEVMQHGAPQKFLSDWWWKVVDATAQACRDEGLLYWAYDEQDWPSGSIGGQLLECHPEFRWKYLCPTERIVHGPASVELTIGYDMFVAAAAFRTEGKAIKADSIIDLREHVKDGQLTWQAPAGDWTVAIYTAVYGPWGWSNVSYPDLMDRRAAAAFVEEVYNGHYQRVSKLSGVSLIGFFTDEPSMTTATYPGGAPFTWYPSMPYSPDVTEAFQAKYGYDWRSRLPLLYRDGVPESLKYRCQFWETCGRLYAENYFGQIYDFCEQRGLKSSGHIHVEESLMAHLTLQGGNVLEIYRRMHVPGVDWIHPFANEFPPTTAKLATSAAHLLGRDRTWCESFAACGWGLTMQETRNFVNWEHVNGINMQVPISYKYSLRGPDRLSFYNPGISYQQPYWEHFRGFADYEARMCLLTSGGGHSAQVAMAYPSVDLWAHCWDHDLLAKRTILYNEMANRIRAGGYDYDILDDRAILSEVKIEKGLLRSPTETYSLVVLPQMDAVRRESLSRYVDFVKQGGKLIIYGGLPRHSFEAGSDDPAIAALIGELLGDAAYEQAAAGKPSWHTCGQGRAGFAPTPEDGIKMLWELQTPDLITEPRPFDVFSYHRRLPDGDLYLLFNRKDETRTFDVTLATKGVAEAWDPIRGTIHRLDSNVTDTGTRLHLTFAPFEMVVLAIKPDASRAPRPAGPPHDAIREIPIPGPFKFRVEQTITRPHIAWNFSQADDGWATAPQPAVPEEMPAGDWTVHGLPSFSGLGHYETQVTVDALPPDARAILDLGRVAVTAEVFVNEKPGGYVFFAPYRLDVTDLLQPGVNRIRIVVANTLVNYYSQFKEVEKYPATNGGIQADHKTSGLLGPVVLRVMR